MKRKKKPVAHPKYRRIVQVLAPDPDGKLVIDVKREYPKPAPNRHHDIVPPIEAEEPGGEFLLGDVAEVPATTEVVEEAEVCEVVIETPAHSLSAVAVVVMPPIEEVFEADSDADDFDPELLALITGDDAVPEWTENALPEGFHPTRADHTPPLPTPSYVVRRRLSAPSQEQPEDWGDHEVIYSGHEQPFLLEG